jgi:hypothetical protein
MSERMAHLRLNKREACALIEWFWFQEQNDVRTKPSSLTEDDFKLLKSIIRCVLQMRKEPEKFVAMRLSTESCKIAFDWFNNLPKSIIDSRDADIHANLGHFLNSQE